MFKTHQAADLKALFFVSEKVVASSSSFDEVLAAHEEPLGTTFDPWGTNGLLVVER